MSLQTRLSALITAIGADMKALQSAQTLVTSLPTTGPSGGALVDGQECRYLADATNGIVWNLKYKSSVSKWLFIGGSSLSNRVDTNETKAVAAGYADITTVGPSVTVPLAGDYLVEWGMDAVIPANYAANTFASVELSVGGVLDVNTGLSYGPGPAGGVGNSAQANLAGARKMTFTAAQVVKMQYNSTTTACNFRWRWLKITPIQVA
jgi:hypothetical protein